MYPGNALVSPPRGRVTNSASRLALALHNTHTVIPAAFLVARCMQFAGAAACTHFRQSPLPPKEPCRTMVVSRCPGTETGRRTVGRMQVFFGLCVPTKTRSPDGEGR